MAFDQDTGKLRRQITRSPSVGEHGRAVSSISAPWLQAQMIEDAQIPPGERILEIGSGDCAAALYAELTGPEGTVVTVDIDPWVTGRAARFLAAAGYGNVQVVTGDSEHASDPYGPFDVVIVTAGTWDCPWAKLLADGGRMVVPEFGVHDHGPHAAELAGQLTRHVQQWDRGGRRGPGPDFTLYPMTPRSRHRPTARSSPAVMSRSA